MLLLYLVKNPLITLPEVVSIAKMPSIDSLVAEQIVRSVRTNPQWAMNEELKVSIALNVKTPGGTAISMLRHLNTKSLRRVAKAEVNSSLKNACVKILMERKD
jgi:pyrroline-5-carboxylate reductase